MDETVIATLSLTKDSEIHLHFEGHDMFPHLYSTVQYSAPW